MQLLSVEEKLLFVEKKLLSDDGNLDSESGFKHFHPRLEEVETTVQSGKRPP